MNSDDLPWQRIHTEAVPFKTWTMQIYHADARAKIMAADGRVFDLTGRRMMVLAMYGDGVRDDKIELLGRKMYFGLNEYVFGCGGFGKPAEWSEYQLVWTVPNMTPKLRRIVEERLGL